MSNMNQYAKLFNATLYRRSNPDKAKTLAAFQQRAANVHDAMVEVRAERDKHIEHAKHNYAHERLDAEINGINAAYAEVLETARKRVENDLDDVLTAKRTQYKRSQAAPTDADIRLLQTLRMRNDLTDDDISAAAEQLTDTLPGLKALGSIAKDAGLPFPDFTQFDQTFEENMAAAQDHVERMMQDIDTPIDEMNYLPREFFGYPDKRGWTYKLFAPLDASVFTAAQTTNPERAAVSAAKKEKEAMKDQPASSNNAAKVFLRGDENLSGIALQFGVTTGAIRQANPDADLDNLSAYTSIVVPSTRFTYAGTPGSIIQEQVIPTRFDPAELPARHDPGDVVDVTTI